MKRVRWSGKHRAPLQDLGVYPRPQQNPLPVWVAVGGTPEPVVRAGSLGLPMALAIIGGMPERFALFVELYWGAARRAGHDPSRLAVSINSHGYLADNSWQAADESFPSVAAVMNREYEVLAFGAIIKRSDMSAPVEQVVLTEPIVGNRTLIVDPARIGGTRHLSAAQFIYDQRDALALVASQDGRFTIFTYWELDKLVHAHRIEALLL